MVPSTSTTSTDHTRGRPFDRETYDSILDDIDRKYDDRKYDDSDYEDAPDALSEEACEEMLGITARSINTYTDSVSQTSRTTPKRPTQASSGKQSPLSWRRTKSSAI